MAVTDRSQDTDRHIGRLEGIVEQMVKDQAEYREDMRATSNRILDQMAKDQAEYRQDMRAISNRIDNTTNRIDKLLYWQLGLLSVIIGGIIGIYFK